MLADRSRIFVLCLALAALFAMGGMCGCAASWHGPTVPRSRWKWETVFGDLPRNETFIVAFPGAKQ